MDKCIVVLINNNQARFFTLEAAEWPEYESGPNLVEQKSLAYSTDNYSQKLWQTIVNREQQNSPKSDRIHGKFERKFAQQITSEIINLIRICQGKKLILVAQYQTLNLIKKFFTPTIFNNLQIEEIPKDISYFKVNQIHQYLAQKKLVPACQKIVYPR